MKRLIILFIVFIMTVYAFCGCTPKEEYAELPKIDQMIEIDPMNPKLYATNLNSITKNDKVLVCSDGKVSWEAEITNVKEPAEYGLFMLVDGMITPFSTDFDENELTMHRLFLDYEERIQFRVTLSSEYIPSDRQVYAEVVTILNPEHKLNSIDYLCYLPHHALAGFTFYKLKNGEKNVRYENKISRESSVIDLPEEINSVYYCKTLDDSGKEKIINLLDDNNEFLLKSTNDFIKLDSLYTAVRGKDFKLKIGCIGKNGKFRLSVYINHEVVPAFDGNMYCDIEVKRDKLTVRNIELPKEYIDSLDEFNHIYVIAVPTEPSLDESSYDRPIKTVTNMLYVSDEENVSKVIEMFPPTDPSINPITDAEIESYNEEPTSFTPSDFPETVMQITTQSQTHTNESTGETTAKHENTGETTAKHESTVETTAKQETTGETTAKHESTGKTTAKHEEPATKNTTSSSEDTAKKSVKEITLTAPISNIWTFEDGSVIVQLADKNKSIHTLDLKSGKLGKEGITGKTRTQKLNNMIAVLNYNKTDFTVYDKKLNKLSSGKMPFSVDDEFSYAVSYDGKSVAYCLNEKGKATVYTDSIMLNNRKKLLTLSSASKQGAVTWIDEISVFRDGHILFEGAYVEKTDSRGNSTLQTCYGCLDTSGEIFKQNTDGYNRSCVKGNYLTLADNFSHNGKSVDGTVEYLSAKSGNKSSFTFSSSGESRYACVSESGKYICGMAFYGEKKTSTVRIYDVSSGKVLFDETYSYNSLESYPIDFCESGGYAVLGVGNKVYKISLNH